MKKTAATQPRISHLRRRKIATEDEIAGIEADATRIIEEAIAFATEGANPKIEEVTRDVYTEETAS